MKSLTGHTIMLYKMADVENSSKQLQNEFLPLKN